MNTEIAVCLCACNLTALVYSSQLSYSYKHLDQTFFHKATYELNSTGYFNDSLMLKESVSLHAIVQDVLI